MALTVVVPYITVADADIHFGQRLNTDLWDNASAPNKDKALAQATLILDGLRYVGSKTDEDQTSEFPRNGETTIPEEVQRATAEQALALLESKTLEAVDDATGVASEKAGDASVSYTTDGKQVTLGKNLGLTSPTAARFLREWIADPREIIIDRVG